MHTIARLKWFVIAAMFAGLPLFFSATTPVVAQNKTPALVQTVKFTVTASASWWIPAAIRKPYCKTHAI